MGEFTYISLGAGIQSTAMLICSDRGLHGIPRADVAVFADPQNELKETYAHLARLRDWSDIPVHVASRGNLLKDAVARNNGRIKRFAAIPLWTLGKDGKAVPMRRQCTREYKVEVCERHVRAILGYRPRQPCKHKVTCMLGFSRDEASRASPSRTPWVTNVFPLVDADLTKAGCIRINEEHGFTDVPKSACNFCPYRGDAEWLRMQRDAPKDFARAVAADKAMRDQTASGLNEESYVHRALVPLDEVDFEARLRLPLFDHEDQFGNECEGMCGV